MKTENSQKEWEEELVWRQKLPKKIKFYLIVQLKKLKFGTIERQEELWNKNYFARKSPRENIRF